MTRRAVTSAFAASVLVVNPGQVNLGHAQPAPPSASGSPAPASSAKLEEARAHYKRGLQLYGEGAYGPACEELGRAYELAPNYKLLYDIGVCSQAQGRYVEAIKSFEGYLARGNELPAERQKEVTKELDSLRGRVSFITVTTNVPGAELLVDDAVMGTVSPEPVMVNPGRRKVWVTKQGYYPASQELTLVGADRIDVSLELKVMPPPPAVPKPSLLGRPVVLASIAGGAIFVLALGILARRKSATSASRALPKLNAFGTPTRADEIPVEPTPSDTRVIVCDPDAAAEPNPARGLRPLVLESGAVTDIGKVKPTNQDAFLLRQDAGLFVVADGIGGYAGGEIASATAIEVIGASLASDRIDVGQLTHLPKLAGELARAVFAANAGIRAKAAADWNVADMGTTCVAARFSQDRRRMCIAHIGDSRVYRLRRGVLEQLTTDHTMENLGMVGVRSAHLAAALGADPCPKIDVLLASPEANDTYVLCSDGLSKMVPDSELQELLRGPRSGEVLARMLVDAANAAGGKDNVTALVISVTG